MNNNKCIVCGSESITQIFSPSSKYPLARYGLTKTSSAALSCSKYEVDVHVCGRCGHFFNLSYKENSISYSDETVQEGRPFSQSYNSYQKIKAEKIKTDFLKDNNVILEIGCGDGLFLSRFSDETNTLIGYEPSTESDLVDRNNITLYQNYFVPDYSLHNEMKPSFIIMRHVLEHVEDPLIFIKTFYSMLSENNSDEKLLYIEVPSNNKTLNSKRFSDFYYDHVSYFTISSLSYLLTSVGFFIESISTDFDNEILSCIATIKIPSRIKIDMDDSMEFWTNLIDSFYDKGKKVIFWGTAGTGTMFLNILKLYSEKYPYVIDSDERKQGKFVPGTGQLVVNPQFIKEYSPDVVIILSQLHSIEIKKTINELLKKKIDILVIS
jgi:hypothetical protein